MKKFSSSTNYQEQMKKSGLSQANYFVLLTSKLIQYFIKSFMSYTFDANSPIPEEKIKEWKEKDKTITPENIMREINPVYLKLHNMLDILGPWIQGFSKSNELLNSKNKKAPGAKHFRTYANEFAGFE